MANSVVHFEIVGQDPARLREYYGELFGWQFDTSAPISGQISEPGEYGFTQPDEGIPGGVGGGPAFGGFTVFYVGVENVGEALAKAEELGGSRVLGPERVEERGLVIAHFRDPEGHLIGLAGPA